VHPAQAAQTPGQKLVEPPARAFALDAELKRLAPRAALEYFIQLRNSCETMMPR
jgi:hypothetical protein